MLGASLYAGAVAGGYVVALDHGPAVEEGSGSLAGIARKHGRVFGTAVGPLIETSPDYGRLVTAECGVVVPEYELKWRHVAPTPATYDFAAVDRRLAFAESNGLGFRGHTLVWHEALPRWFDEIVGTDNAAACLTAHIRTVVGRYAGRIHSWDVVNEAVDPAEPDGLRRTPWRRLIGPDYVRLAYETAAAADPRAKLVYNDYGLVVSATDAKRDATLRLLERLLARGVPVHALGLQCHLQVGTRLDEARVRRFCADIAGLGLEIMVTELDVADRRAPADIDARDGAVAEVYRTFLGCLLEQPATSTVLTWGLSDIHSWLQTYQPRADGLPCRVLPYDQRLRRKPAWNAIAGALAL